MRKNDLLFFDIDTQYDFIMPGGNLYVKGAEEIIPNLEKLTSFAIENDIPVFASADSHPEDDPEFEQFPPHCLTGSAGNRKIKETYLPNAVVLRYSDEKSDLNLDNLNGIVFTKNTFDVFSNPFVEELLKEINPVNIILYGVATDYCVKAAAESLLQRGYDVSLVSDAVKAVDENEGVKVLGNLKKRGVKLVKTADVLKMKAGQPVN